jgi:signal transduction histidine kinase
LAIIKNFVEAHGGHVSIESRQGMGTKFRFTLPTKTTSERVAIIDNGKEHPDTSLENSKISLND